MTRLVNHNSGSGSSMTTPLRLRPFGDSDFICVFDGNKILRRSIEQQWKVYMYILRRTGITDAK